MVVCGSHRGRVIARAQGYAGEETWGIATLAVTTGHRVGRVHWRTGTTLVQGSNLNTVSAFLTSGSWDATGAGAMYGHAQAEFRVERAALVNTGLDVRVRGPLEVGLRAAWLRNEDQWRSGTMLQVSSVVRGVVVQGGVAAPSGALDRPVVTAGVSWMSVKPR